MKKISRKMVKLLTSLVEELVAKFINKQKKYKMRFFRIHKDDLRSEAYYQILLAYGKYDKKRGELKSYLSCVTWKGLVKYYLKEVRNQKYLERQFTDLNELTSQLESTGMRLVNFLARLQEDEQFAAQLVLNPTTRLSHRLKECKSEAKERIVVRKYLSEKWSRRRVDQIFKTIRQELSNF